ncbi:hypothetical protein [Streptomyces sp. NPDC003710]
MSAPAADRARATMDRYADREDTSRPHPARADDQRAHQSHEPGPGQNPGAHR